MLAMLCVIPPNKELARDDLRMMLGRKLDLSNKGEPGVKGCQLTLNSIPHTPRRAH